MMTENSNEYITSLKSTLNAEDFRTLKEINIRKLQDSFDDYMKAKQYMLDHSLQNDAPAFAAHIDKRLIIIQEFILTWQDA